MARNPYEPPRAPREPPASDPRAVRRRRELLPIEARVRGIAVVVALAGLGHGLSLIVRAANPLRDIAQSGYHALGAVSCIASALLLYRMDVRGRTILTAWFPTGLTIAAVLWAAFGALPLALVLTRAAVTAAILAYLHYHDGAVVLDKAHRSVIEQTPEIDAPVSSSTVVALAAIGFAISLLFR